MKKHYEIKHDDHKFDTDTKEWIPTHSVVFEWPNSSYCDTVYGETYADLEDKLFTMIEKLTPTADADIKELNELKHELRYGEFTTIYKLADKEKMKERIEFLEESIQNDVFKYRQIWAALREIRLRIEEEKEK